MRIRTTMIILASALLGCSTAAKVVTAPVNAAATVATTTAGAAANVATTTVGAAAGATTAVAGAATAPLTGGTMQPASTGGCQAELGRHCAGVTSGVLACLHSHEADLSANCKAYMSSVERFPTCLGDAGRLCPSTKPSSAALIACMRTRQNDLSDACRVELRKVR